MTINGLHAGPWDKHISVDDGKVLGSWVDLREGETFGNTYQTVIDASKGIFVPRENANSSFQVTLTRFPIAIWWMIIGLELKPKYAFVNYADPALGIQWENLEAAEASGSRQEYHLLT